MVTESIILLLGPDDIGNGITRHSVGLVFLRDGLVTMESRRVVNRTPGVHGYLQHAIYHHMPFSRYITIPIACSETDEL